MEKNPKQQKQKNQTAPEMWYEVFSLPLIVYLACTLLPTIPEVLPV